ncbi:MAG: Mu transposase domain-containing protein [Planctomycetia bacterium]
MPLRPFEPRRVAEGTLDSESLVRFETNDYSVAVRYAHRKVIVIATVDEVRFVYGDRLPARHAYVLGSREGVFRARALPGAPGTQARGLRPCEAFGAMAAPRVLRTAPAKDGSR